MKNFLLIGGFDGTGGAGILTDFKVSSFLGLKPYCLTTVIAVQNSASGFLNFPLPLNVVKVSLDAIFAESQIEFCKIGMVGSFEIANFLANYLSERGVKIILDTPLNASNSFFLQSLEMIKPLIEKSFLITPNKEEFEKLEGFLKIYEVPILVKSFKENKFEIFDKLILTSEHKFFSSKKLNLPFNVRGTGCALSSAICAFLFLGEDLEMAIEKARELILNGIKNAKFIDGAAFLGFS